MYESKTGNSGAINFAAMHDATLRVTVKDVPFGEFEPLSGSN